MADILLIEDDEMALETAAIILESAGHNVVSANDGEQGMRLFEQAHFDVVVTDVVMPNKDGIEVLVALKKDDKEPKIIVISGGGRTSARDYLEMADVIGADATLQKPFTATELIGAVEGVLEK